jgi:hypothetical protein
MAEVVIVPVVWIPIQVVMVAVVVAEVTEVVSPVIIKRRRNKNDCGATDISQIIFATETLVVMTFSDQSIQIIVANILQE